jgi:hypothetical protein
MRTLITLLLLSALLLLAGCNKSIRHCVDADPTDDEPAKCVTVTGNAEADAFYAAQRDAAEARRQQQVEREQRIASLAQACKTDACVETVAREATLSDAFAAVGGRGDAPVRQFVRQPGAVENVTRDVVRGIPGLGNVWAQVEGINANRDIALGSQDAGVRELEAWGGLTRGIVDGYSRLPPSTQIIVGNDYVTGQIGDNAGRDQIAGDQFQGDWRTGDDTRRDTIGRDRIDNAGNLGDGNRQDSPDDDSVECTGPGCMGVNRPITNPLPDPEEDEG